MAVSALPEFGIRSILSGAPAERQTEKSHAFHPATVAALFMLMPASPSSAAGKASAAASAKAKPALASSAKKKKAKTKPAEKVQYLRVAPSR
jgi:hypothetical protein